MGKKKLPAKAESFFVGVAGLEPTTSWSQTKHTTNCTTPRISFLSEKVAFNLLAVRGGFEPPVPSPVRQFSKLLV